MLEKSPTPTVVVPLTRSTIATVLFYADSDSAKASEPKPGSPSPVSRAKRARPSPIGDTATAALKIAQWSESVDRDNSGVLVQFTRADAIAVRNYLRDLASRPRMAGAIFREAAKAVDLRLRRRVTWRSSD